MKSLLDFIGVVEGTVGEASKTLGKLIESGGPYVKRENETQEAYETRLKFLAEERERKRQTKLERKKIKAEVIIAKAEQKTLERVAKIEKRQARQGLSTR